MKAGAICALFAVFIVLSAMAFAEPTVSIITDKSSYKAGDTMMISLNVQNPGDSTALDPCVGLLMPDGRIYTLGYSGWSASIRPGPRDCECLVVSR